MRRARRGAMHADRRAGCWSMPGTTSPSFNLPPLKEAIPDLAEVSIGHAVTADALICGMAETMRTYEVALA